MTPPLKPPPLTEEQWQQQILDLAALKGWKAYHTRDSRRSVPGFPDLVLLKATRLVVAELKKNDREKPTPEQLAWLAAFGDAGAETYIWRPSDLTLVRSVLT